MEGGREEGGKVRMDKGREKGMEERRREGGLFKCLEKYLDRIVPAVISISRPHAYNLHFHCVSQVHCMELTPALHIASCKGDQRLDLSEGQLQTNEGHLWQVKAIY